jgi:hypothetical protein
MLCWRPLITASVLRGSAEIPRSPPAAMFACACTPTEAIPMSFTSRPKQFAFLESP